MRLFLLLQQLLLLVIARQVQSHVTPRTFKIMPGCNAAQTEIILKEIDIAKKAAEFAAEKLTKYPYFHAFQEPTAFDKKELENTGKEVFTRIAAMLDGFHMDNKFTIRCGGEYCGRVRASSAAVTVTKLDGTTDPIVSFCKLFFEPSWSTQDHLERYKKAIGNYPLYTDRWSGRVNMQDVSNSRANVILHELTHTTYVAMPIKKLLGREAEEELFVTDDIVHNAPLCYKLARGYHDKSMKQVEPSDRKKGARKAAENAENWALIASGMYMSKELGVKQIPIKGIADYKWENPRRAAS
ncbi:Putative metallopeptidase, catalytic domain superfamily [Colletotrichum destructivum]|uniref:Metallopeptidase, catalytic domain superfamily n=1 Tax=Colletotrichum destructivum TaxID=34406 RepID=A0AAX4J4C3_9PEZI|nr:Putative metallopeptidase, catalytic domain superfamily [Colletotrichum destructivum]